MAIANMDDFVAALAASSAQRKSFYKIPPSSVTVGNVVTYSYSAGFPAAFSQPPLNTAGSGYTCDKGTPGAIPITNGNLQLFLAQLSAVVSSAGILFIYDRLWAASFAAPTGAGTVTFTTPGSLPARITDNGVGVEAWLESYTAGGVASGTVTLNYLDTTGASKSGAITPATSPALGRAQFFPLAQGSLGISQVVSIGVTATMTSGTYALVLKKRIAEFPIVYSGTPAPSADFAALGLPKIPNGACIEIMFTGSGAANPQLIGTFTIIDA